MTYSDKIVIKPKSKVDNFYKVYIPKSVREKVNIEQGEAVSLSLNIKEKAIKIKKLQK